MLQGLKKHYLDEVITKLAERTMKENHIDGKLDEKIDKLWNR